MTSSDPRYGNTKDALIRVPSFGGGLASFNNHQKITDLRPELFSLFGLLFIMHLELQERVGNMIFDDIRDIGWLRKLREAKWFPSGKSTDKLGKKNASLQSFAARILPQGFPLSWVSWSSKSLGPKRNA